MLTVKGVGEWGKLHPTMLPANFTFKLDDGYEFNKDTDGWTLLKDFRNNKIDVFWEKVTTLEMEFSDI